MLLGSCQADNASESQQELTEEEANISTKPSEEEVIETNEVENGRDPLEITSSLVCLTGSFEGKIGKNAITVYLEIAGGVAKGYYFYNNINVKIPLKGSLEYSTLRLKEYNKESVTGIWELELMKPKNEKMIGFMSDGRLSSLDGFKLVGDWYAADRSKQLSLEVQTIDASVLLDNTIVGSNYKYKTQLIKSFSIEEEVALSILEQKLILDFRKDKISPCRIEEPVEALNRENLTRTSEENYSETIVFAKGDVISIHKFESIMWDALNESSYTTTYDIKTGEKLVLKDIIKADALEAFNAIIKKYEMKERGGEVGEDCWRYSQADLETSSFEISGNNLALESKCNPEEMTPDWVAFRIPIQELKSIMNKSSAVYSLIE